MDGLRSPVLAVLRVNDGMSQAPRCHHAAARDGNRIAVGRPPRRHLARATVICHAVSVPRPPIVMSVVPRISSSTTGEGPDVGTGIPHAVAAQIAAAAIVGCSRRMCMVGCRIVTGITLWSRGWRRRARGHGFVVASPL